MSIRQRPLASTALTERHERLAGVTTAITELGEGPPMILLHGQGEYWGVWMAILDDLDRITVPTTLIHGRHDLQVSLHVAEAASRRYGWPLHVIDDVRDDPADAPAAEQPAAFVTAVRAALASARTQQRAGA